MGIQCWGVKKRGMSRTIVLLAHFIWWTLLSLIHVCSLTKLTPNEIAYLYEFVLRHIHSHPYLVTGGGRGAGVSELPRSL